MTTLLLPWPSSALAGHAGGHWRPKARATKLHRSWAYIAAKGAPRPHLPEAGDIALHVTFYPPNLRGDRTNYPNRLKPYFDGLAEAWGVNDRRFVPAYTFGPVKPSGCVEVRIGESE